MIDLPEYQDRGARALVVMHEDHLRRYVATWERAKAADITLPETDDPNYASLDHLTSHVLRCARHYLNWICKQLGLPDPDIDPEPPLDDIAADTHAYTDYVLAKWRTPLAEVAPKRFNESYESSWRAMYCIDGMLEHAVMHPMRHTFQLEALLAEQG